jgi:hypothetical protein
MAAFTIVNGYVCRNCTDIDLAKKGVDPAHPPDKFDPTQAAKDGKSDPTKPGSDLKQTAAAVDGVNRPLLAGTIGTQVNILT